MYTLVNLYQTIVKHRLAPHSIIEHTHAKISGSELERQVS
jgi:hypothetical protein